MKKIVNISVPTDVVSLETLGRQAIVGWKNTYGAKGVVAQIAPEKWQMIAMNFCSSGYPNRLNDMVGELDWVIKENMNRGTTFYEFPDTKSLMNFLSINTHY